MAAPARDVGGDIIEKDKRIMPCDVRIVIQERVVGVVIIFLITLPGNARVFEQRDQMIGRADVMERRRTVIEDAEVSPRLQPDVVRLAGMQVGRSKVSLRQGGHRQERVIDVRAVRVALNGGPIAIFHHDKEYRLDVGQ